MKRIYVAGPYSHGDIAVNVRNAMEAGSQIINAGHSPFVPHLSHFLHMHHPQEYAVWMRIDAAWVEVCDALLRLPGHSPGADAEIALARVHGIPCFWKMDELLEWLSA